MKSECTAQTTDSLTTQSSHIYAFYKKNKRMPSYSEVCKICAIKSKNTAHTLVRKLSALGLIHTDSSGKLIPVQTPAYAKNFNSTYNSGCSIKLLGLVEAGFPTPSEESLHENISLDDWVIGKREASFMLRVKGNSMKDAGILDGDMVIVERTNTPKIGQIVVAEVDGLYTLKYLRKDSHGAFYLEPANSDFEPIYPEQNMQVSAVVKAVVRKY